MSGTETARTDSEAGSTDSGSDAIWCASVFALVAGALFAVVAASAAWLPIRRDPTQVRTRDWLAAWAHFDGRWYLRIARGGYEFGRARHSGVSFFPAYPLAIHAATLFGVSFLAAGVGTTLVCGALAVILFRVWLSERMSRAAARIAVLTLLLYPFAFFVAGAVYSDALFLVAAIGAFVAAERRCWWLAAALGGLATMTRPVGIALVVGLIALAWEQERERDRRRGSGYVSRDRTTQKVRRTLGLKQVVIASLAASGLLLYCTYLALRFGDPLAFVHAERHWHQAPGLATFFKIPLFRELSHWGWSSDAIAHFAQLLIAIVALALVPQVLRRFGRPYGLYTLLVLAIPMVFTKDFFGMGRYVLAAFPCFAVVGERLAAQSPRRIVVVLAASALALVVLASLFARSYYLS